MRKLLVVECPDETFDIGAIAWQPDKTSPTALLGDGETHQGVSVHEATPADVTAAFVEQTEASGAAKKICEWTRPTIGGTAKTMYAPVVDMLEVLGLSALLDVPLDVEAEVLRQTAREGEGGHDD